MWRVDRPARADASGRDDPGRRRAARRRRARRARGSPAAVVRRELPGRAGVGHGPGADRRPLQARPARPGRGDRRVARTPAPSSTSSRGAPGVLSAAAVALSTRPRADADRDHPDRRTRSRRPARTPCPRCATRCGAWPRPQPPVLGGAAAEAYDARIALADDAKLIVPLVADPRAGDRRRDGAGVHRAAVSRRDRRPVLRVRARRQLAAVPHVLGQPASDPALPTFAFVFLVALGVDYNVFLISRIREERARRDAQRRRDQRPRALRWRDHERRPDPGRHLPRARRRGHGLAGPGRLHRRLRPARGHVPRALLPGPGDRRQARRPQLVAAAARRAGGGRGRRPRWPVCSRSATGAEADDDHRHEHRRQRLGHAAGGAGGRRGHARGRTTSACAPPARSTSTRRCRTCTPRWPSTGPAPSGCACCAPRTSRSGC